MGCLGFPRTRQPVWTNGIPPVELPQVSQLLPTLVICTTQANSSLGHISGPRVWWLFPCSCSRPRASANHAISSWLLSTMSGLQESTVPSQRAVFWGVPGTSRPGATLGCSLYQLRCQEPEAPPSWLMWPARQLQWWWEPAPLLPHGSATHYASSPWRDCRNLFLILVPMKQSKTESPAQKLPELTGSSKMARLQLPGP